MKLFGFNVSRMTESSNGEKSTKKNKSITANISNINSKIPRLSESIFGKITENISGAGFGNIDAGTEFDDRLFTQIGTGAGTKIDLPTEKIQTGQRLSLLLYRKNVRAFSAIELIKDFVLGDGIRFKANNSEVQKVLEEHWEENQWMSIIEERIRSLAIFGEQLYPVFIDGDTGMVKVSSISPFFIQKVLRDPDDAEKLKSVIVSLFKLPAGKGETAEAELIEFNLIQKPGSEVLDNPAFFFGVNRISGATRGTPDLLPSLDWLEGLDNMVFSMLERASLSQNVVFDLKMEGLNEKQLREEGKKFMAALRSGEAFAHNESVELGIQVPKLGSSDSETMTSIILKQIQAGTRLAGLFFGDSDDLTRSSASELSVPVAKAIQGRQNFVRRMVEKIFKFQITQSKKAGTLPKDVDEGFEIEMARVFLRDTSVIAASLKDLSETLETAVANQWITNEQAAKFYRSGLEELGTVGAGLEGTILTQENIHVEKDNQEKDKKQSRRKSNKRNKRTD